MSEELSKGQAVPEMESGDEHTTPPMPAAPAAPAAQEKWSMPEPVFQQTSGYLPQGFLKEIEQSNAGTPSSDVLEIPTIASNTPIAPLGQSPVDPILEMDEPTVAASPAATPQSVNEPVPAADKIEAQPDLSEQIVAEAASPAPVAAPAKSSGMRTVLIALALLAMLGLLIVFLAFVYLYFIAGTWNSTTF